MRYCQSCALENEGPMPVGAQLTVIGKCDECGKVRPCTEVPAQSEAFMRYPGTAGKYDGIDCKCTSACRVRCDGTCGCEACTRSWLDDSEMTDRIGTSWPRGDPTT